MANEKTIQECCKDAMLRMAREKDKLRILLQTLKGAKELHLDENGVDGLCYTLEDVVEAVEGMLEAQCALAAVNADAAKEDRDAVAKSPTDYGAVPGRDC